MQRSFSIVDEDTDLNDELLSLTQTKNKKFDQIGQRYSFSKENNNDNLDDNSDSDDNKFGEKGPHHKLMPDSSLPGSSRKHLIPQMVSTNSSAGPSGRQTTLKSNNRSISKDSNHQDNLSSGSELDDSDNEDIKKDKLKIPGEYDPKQYENLDVNDEAKEIFQYIIKYTPQYLELDTKFKPFIPDFLPAVGDIDAFLKVIPPNVTLSGKVFEEHKELGLVVLDEPTANQSDPALLHLQLRAASVNPVIHHNADNMIVKKVDNVEKNVKTIDKWIKDISDLHKSKSSPMVRYSETMPDLEDLMQEWSEDMEKELNKNGFPKPTPDMSLTDYVKIVCNTFQIPVNKNQMQSLHLLFCLYATVKSSQLYQTSNNNNNRNNQIAPEENNKEDKNKEDHLILE